MGSPHKQRVLSCYPQPPSIRPITMDKPVMSVEEVEFTSASRHEEQEKPSAEPTTHDLMKDLDSIAVDNIHEAPGFQEAARLATEREHELTFRQALRLYPGGFMWAILISFTIIMEGWSLHVSQPRC